MASGKSSVGRALAHRRSLSFVDTDAMIVERHGSIEQIFEHKGEAEFRQMERDVGEAVWKWTRRDFSTLLLDSN